MRMNGPPRGAPYRSGSGSSYARVNLRIRVPQVRCVGPDGNMLGVLPTREAQKLADQHKLDLVEIAPQADPPVCRIMDYGKYKFQEALKKKQARKNQSKQQVKEIKFHANVAEHDYQTKLNHMREFLKKGHKVKISLQFRGRENAHRELGMELVKRVIDDCKDISVIDMTPRIMGRQVLAMLGAKSSKT